MLMALAATLKHAYEFILWHQKHAAERNARDQYLAADGITPKNYRTTDPLLSQAFRALAPQAAYREDS